MKCEFEQILDLYISSFVLNMCGMVDPFSQGGDMITKEERRFSI